MLVVTINLTHPFEGATVFFGRALASAASHPTCSHVPGTSIGALTWQCLSRIAHSDGRRNCYRLRIEPMDLPDGIQTVMESDDPRIAQLRHA
jgi:hypothetical protein